MNIDDVFKIGLPKCRAAHYAMVAGKPFNKLHADLYRFYIKYLAGL